MTEQPSTCNFPSDTNQTADDSTTESRHSEPFLRLLREIAESHGLTADVLLSESRSGVAVRARREAMLAAQNCWGWQVCDLARAFGRHHATVAYHLRIASRESAERLQTRERNYGRRRKG